MNESLALIVDDEPDIRELLEITLGRMKITTCCAENAREAERLLASRTFDLCITDMNLPDGNGIDLVSHIQKHYPTVPVAVLTAYGSMGTAVAALKAGAFDFVSKPVDLNVLRELINTALKLRTIEEKTPAETGNVAILGESPQIERMRKQAAKLARSQAPVYINGESGTGKELVARLMHELGPRKDSPFVPVNCGAIPTELMESEFFGHKKGSFTGAIEDKVGLFQAAHGGTLFLDEVADLPMTMQVKLLRVIQEKAVRAIGAQKEIQVDVRILSATHKNLAALVSAGEFRQDLFYRINVIQLNVPALRERQDDIVLLAKHFLQRISTEWDIETPQFADDAIDALKHYRFPGNVRELENILERAMTLCEDNVLSAQSLHLPGVPSTAESGRFSTDETQALEEGESLEDYLTDIEKNAILKALEETHWNRTAAAKKLGMSFRSLRYRLKKLALDDSVQGS